MEDSLPAYDILDETGPARKTTVIQAQWATVLATDAGVQLAASLLRNGGLGQRIANERDRVLHNEAVRILEDIVVADPSRAVDVVLLAILPGLQLPLLPRT